MKVIKLRPHHINCIYFFIGLGYNEEFVENMKNVIKRLKTDKDIKIQFTTETDKLCCCCPNKIKNLCNTEEKVKQFDHLTIKYYNIELNKLYDYTFLEDIYKHFNYETLKNICGCCEWYKQGICGKNNCKSEVRFLELLADEKK